MEAQRNPKMRGRNVSANIWRDLFILALVAALSITWLYMGQRNDAVSTHKQLSHVTASKLSFQQKSSALTVENQNLTKSVQSLQKQLATQSAPVPSTQSSGVPAGSLVITSVSQAQITTYPPTTPGLWPPYISAIAVHVTIHNLTSSNQTYGTDQFGAITDAGVVTSTLAWTPNISQTPWTYTTIVPGASIDETVYYDTDNTYATLTWLAPGQSTPIDVPFPSTN